MMQELKMSKKDWLTHKCNDFDQSILHPLSCGIKTAKVAYLGRVCSPVKNPTMYKSKPPLPWGRLDENTPK